MYLAPTAPPARAPPSSRSSQWCRRDIPRSSPDWWRCCGCSVRTGAVLGEVAVDDGDVISLYVMQVARHEHRERGLACSAFLGGESNIQWFVFLFVHCLLGFIGDTYIDTFVCQFIGSFRLTFQPHSRRPSVATANSPCGDTAGETDNQVLVATNQWLLGHESLSTNQPTVCLTPFGLSVQINNKMSVLLSFLL